ncbi:hypothetical protein FQN57_003755 [Myotisia sp. PD_48]|nr:hypothetical protein FQN57_003755 [Myotisia sp. PD_48]
MEAIQINEFLPSYQSLQPQIIPLPRKPGPGEALVEIHCAALNHVDLLYVRGKHQNNVSLIRPPFTLGLEFAGTVLAVGPSPTSNSKSKSKSKPTSTGSTIEGHVLSPGDRVFGSGLGAYAEQILVPIQALHRIPASLSFEAGAALGSTVGVAFGAVIVRGAVREGEWVLVHGAAGGIGVYACQLAKARGAKVIGGLRDTSDTAKVQALKETHSIDAVVATGADSGWEEEVQKITGGRGVDLVIDNVGLVKESIRCLKPLGGRIVLVGFAGRAGVMEQLSVNRILLKQAVIIGYRYGDTYRKNPRESMMIWRGLMALMDSNAVIPIVYKKKYYGLNSVKDAMADLEAKKHYGKAIIQIKGTTRASL